MSKRQSKTESAAAVSSTPLMGITSNCLRCGTPCRLGTPDPKARAIVQASKAGFCPNCMITRFFLGIEVLRDTIEGTPARGNLVATRPGLGPEIFLNAKWREKTLRPVMRGLLSHTQMPEDSINWIEVVGNWGMPWPKGHEPKEMQ
jgi:hypothetical protein